MDKIKICFIICGSDDFLCEENLLYIQHLNVPENVEVDCITIKGAGNIAEAYNAGMNETDAKYKVYLNENVFIVNRDFIREVLEIFLSDSRIGLLGVIGYYIDTVGQKQNALCIKGGAIIDTIKADITEERFGTVKEPWEEVLFMEQNFIVTAYDMPWEAADNPIRSSMFKSEELRQYGYISVVPAQKELWCIYDNDLFQKL